MVFGIVNSVMALPFFWSLMNPVTDGVRSGMASHKRVSHHLPRQQTGLQSWQKIEVKEQPEASKGVQDVA